MREMEKSRSRIQPQDAAILGQDLLSLLFECVLGREGAVRNLLL